jgi:hypothetical protein
VIGVLSLSVELLGIVNENENGNGNGNGNEKKLLSMRGTMMEMILFCFLEIGGWSYSFAVGLGLRSLVGSRFSAMPY